MGMKFISRTSLCFFFLLAAQLFGQIQMGGERPAATAPILEASGGYVFTSMTSPSSPRLNFNGINGNGLLHFTPRWGATLDLTFSHSGTISGTSHSDNTFSALIGPVFYLMDHQKTGVFVHALIGTAWVDSAVPINSTTEFKGYETRFSYAFGGGVERALGNGPFAVRVTGDYQRTTFVDSTLALEGQNNLRVTTSLVYRFGSR